jgi:hypothetical protein
MTSSGTYAFNPAVGELVINAYARCGIRRTMFTAEHMQDARMECNLMLSDWSSRQPNLWTVDLQSEPLVEGVSTYTLDPETVLILDAYRSTTSGGQTTDLIMFPISRTDYASFSNKTTEGLPTVFWFNRQATPQVTVWQPPDGNGPYTFKYYRVRQVQDANLSSGQTPEIPYRFLDAFAAGLAARVARIYAPDRFALLKADAQEAWNNASIQDTENVQIYISPQFGNFYR